jgi:hypothetical protein
VIKPSWFRAAIVTRGLDALCDFQCADVARPLPARNPQAGGNHQRAHRLDSQSDAMTFPQLLARERRAEVRIALTDQRQRPLCLARRQLAVARVPTLA